MTTWKKQDLDQKPAIFVDRCQEPGDVELPGDVRQSGTARHQDQTAVPDRQKLVLRHQDWPALQRRMDQDFLLASLGQQQETAIAQGGDGRQGCARKPRPVGPAHPGLESEILGAPEHLRCTNLVRSKLMRDLSGISRDALEMQQRHQHFETRIGRPCGAGFAAHWLSPGRVGSGVGLRQQRLLGK